MRRSRLLAVLAAAALLAPAAPAQTRARPPAAQPNPQQQITESQRRLQEIRQERSELRRDLDRIRGQVHDVSAEIRNIQRQREVSGSLLRELNFQLTETERKILTTTAELVATQGELAEKRGLLNRRLRDIYKRGPLQTQEVLLSAHSFSDLLNRYKYLYLVASRDRTLTDEVAELQRELEIRERELRRSYADLQYLQTERAQENSQLSQLQSQRGATLSSLRSHERTTSRRMEELARDERRLTSLVATLEARRREEERRERERLAAERERARANPGRPAPPPAPSRTVAPTITTADIGALNWPVAGRVLYRFGRAVQPNGTAIRYNGVGIGAAAGSEVRAVEAGKVEMAGPFEGYGPTVVVHHGGGYYSLYLYLKEVSVQEGATIQKGQRVGTVGGEQTPEGAHVEFQIRAPGGEAVDPLNWLRGR
ncbi:MAG TPA: peptidoglycan DD-metalloendopeptidase family protein [Longimicrobiaceae bacterium]|nr:peptidoglycan DD-metalloendopeptidase family protein [Longimicrobiaceae bacterium]